MKQRRLQEGKVLILAICLVFSFSILGCPHVQLIAPYDERIDQGVTALQKQTAEFFTGLERQGGSKPDDYKNHTKFYDDVKVALSGLIVRSQAIPLNTETTTQLELLKQKYDKLEHADQKHGIPLRAVVEYESSFNDAFTYILQLDLKKQNPKAGGTGK